MKPSGAKQSNAVRNGLLSLLGLVACFILIFSNSGRLPNQLHRFIEHRVIPGFEGQRQQRYQFAVLLLIPESDLNNINLVSLQPQDINQQPLVDNANCYCPNRTCYRNYVAARPHLNHKGIAVHSEETLLQELPHLWAAFVASYGFIPSFIILYSWMMPCPHCTEQICRTLQDPKYENTSVIIAYTIDWKKCSDVENEESRDKLQAAGIKVEQVEYSSYLPPAREHEHEEVDREDGESIAKKMTKLHLHETLHDVTDSEEYDDDEDSDEDSDEEYDDAELSWQLQEDLVEDIYSDTDPTSQLLQDYTSEQPNNGPLPNGHPPEGQEAFPEVPVRRKPPQAKIHSTQDDAKSPDTISNAHHKYFLRLLRTDNDNMLQCTDSEDSDTESGTHVPGGEPPDRYKLT